MLSGANMPRRDQFDDGETDALKRAADGLQQWHDRAQGENAQGRQSVGSRESNEFRDEVAEKDDDGEKPEHHQPLRQVGRVRSFPEQGQTRHDEKNVDQSRAEQNGREYSPRIFAECLNKSGQGRMICF